MSDYCNKTVLWTPIACWRRSEFMRSLWQTGPGLVWCTDEGLWMRAQPRCPACKGARGLWQRPLSLAPLAGLTAREEGCSRTALLWVRGSQSRPAEPKAGLKLLLEISRVRERGRRGRARKEREGFDFRKHRRKLTIKKDAERRRC